jgi:Tol biopolymer transport system component
LALIRNQGREPAFSLPPSDWLPSGDILFSLQSGDSTNLWTLPISSRTWQIRGPARPVTAGSAAEVDPRFATGPGGVSRFVFCSRAVNSDIWTLPVDVNQGKATGELHRLAESVSENSYPTLSDDESKMVFISNRSGNADIWLRDMRSGKEAVLNASPQSKRRAVISPDGSRVAYFTYEDQKDAISVMQVAGTREFQKICLDCGFPVSWSPDGKSLLYSRDKPIRWFLLDAESGKSTELLKHPKYDIHRTQISPDGQWLAFNPKIGPRKEPICVAPYRPGSSPVESEWIEITDGSGYDNRPLWAPSGNLL